MTNIDMSLDDIINNKSGSGVRGRAPGGRTARGATTRPSARSTRSAPYQRGGGRQTRGTSDEDHMANASVGDVAASTNPVLKVKSDSKPNTVAGAICNVVREAHRNKAPSVLATGPNAINQAMKAIAIARKYLLDEDKPIDLTCEPKFEQDMRSGSNVCFDLSTSRPIKREPTEEDLTAKEKTEVGKLAGAIAGRVREGEEVAITTKGAIPVLVVVKAIATAQEYLAEESIQLKFAISIVDLENPEIRDATSTYLHFAIVTK